MPYSFALSASMANIYIVFLLKLSVSFHLKSRQGFIAEKVFSVLKKNIKIFQLSSVCTAIITFQTFCLYISPHSLNFTFLNLLFCNKKFKFSL